MGVPKLVSQESRGGFLLRLDANLRAFSDRLGNTKISTIWSMFKDGEPFGQNAINPERSALTRRDFLKLAGTVSAGAAFSEVIAACSRREPGITPEPTSTPISPTPEEAEALQWFVAAEVLAGKEAAFADASLNSRGRLEIIYERAVAALKANPEAQAKNSEFDLFVIKAITADNKEIGFPFITVKKTDPEGKNFVAMLVSTQNGVGKVISLVPYNATSISGEQYGMLALSRNLETEEKLFDADGKPISLWPIFSFPLGVTIEKWREMSAEEKQGQMVLFTPYGDASMGLQKDVPIHGLKVDALIVLATPESQAEDPAIESLREQLKAISEEELQGLGISDQRLEQWIAFAAGSIQELTPEEGRVVEDFLSQWDEIHKLAGRSAIPKDASVSFRGRERDGLIGDKIDVYAVDKNSGRLFLFQHHPLDEKARVALVLAPELPGLLQILSDDGELVNYVDSNGEVRASADAVLIGGLLGDEIAQEGYNKRVGIPRFLLPELGSNYHFFGFESETEMRIMSEAMTIFESRFPLLSAYSEDNYFLFEGAGGAALYGGAVLIGKESILFGASNLVEKFAHETFRHRADQKTGAFCIGLAEEIGDGTIPPGFYQWSEKELVEAIEQNRSEPKLGGYHVSVWVGRSLGLDVNAMEYAIIHGRFPNGTEVAHCGQTN